MNILAIVCLVAVVGLTVFLVIDSIIFITKRVKERKHQKEDIQEIEEGNDSKE